MYFLYVFLSYTEHTLANVSDLKQLKDNIVSYLKRTTDGSAVHSQHLALFCCLDHIMACSSITSSLPEF